MPVRVQIRNAANDLLTISLSEDWTYMVQGGWLPDAAGKIVGDGTNWDRNPWESSGTDAVLYTLDGSGVRVAVLRLNRFLGDTLHRCFNSSGDGQILPTGAAAMPAGAISWKNLDGVFAAPAGDGTDPKTGGLTPAASAADAGAAAPDSSAPDAGAPSG